MAKAMEKQQFISDLSETGSTSITYRLMLDGRPQYVTLFAIRPKEDMHHVIVAVTNIDAAKQREMEFRAALGTAMDIANKDALTKVKNKHAYTQAVKELDEQAAAEGIEYAVIVMDINGLKHVNDTQGHHAGDIYIKDCCHIICSVFKHSPVFRIGGDEFTVLLTGEDFDNRETLLDHFKDIVMENKKKGLASLACGMATFDKGLDKDVESVFERADKAMYDNKKIFKGMH
jgi:diguanylate cyclase (GGDEF)-like protein